MKKNKGNNKKYKESSKKYVENPKKTKNKKFLFLLMWFLLVTIFLSTATYAWFSSNRIVELEFFDIHVETDGGLEISENGIDWKTAITIEELLNAYKTYPNSVNQLPGKLLPVSSGGLLDEKGYLNIFYGVTDSHGTDNYYLTCYRSIEKRSTEEKNDGHFIAFDVFFKSSSKRAMYLSSESDVAYKGDESKGIENSARIAFVNEGNLPSTSAINAIQNIKTSNSNNVIIWEPNYDVHTKNGILNALNVYGINTSATNANIIKYDGIISPFNIDNYVLMGKANSKNYPKFFKPVNVDIYTKVKHTTNYELFSLEPGITKMRIYMWLEGQDVDSENTASSGDITYFLQFTLNP